MEDIFEIHTLNLKRNYDDGDAEDVADDDSDVDDDEGTDQRANYLIKGGLLAAKC